jgi:hypothetical protein
MNLLRKKNLPIKRNPPIAPMSQKEMIMQQQTAILESTVNSAQSLQFDNNKIQQP